MSEKRFRAVVCVTDWYIEDKEISPFAVLTPHQSSDLLNKLYKENEQLKTQLQNTSDQRNEFHRGARENANRVGKLEKENEQLRKENNELKLIIQQDEFAKEKGVN